MSDQQLCVWDVTLDAARAAGDPTADPPIEPIFEGNLVSGYLQLRMEA
eukprot:COSAG02_NODE_71144_length_192_cov_35.645161_1_plen_47_part_01